MNYLAKIEEKLDEINADKYERSTAKMLLRSYGYKRAKRFIRNCRPDTTAPKQLSIMELTKEAPA